MKKYIPIITVASLIWMSCAEVNETKSDDISYMLRLIENDIVLSLDVLDTEGAEDEEYFDGLDTGGGLKVMADTLWPHAGYRLRFGRHVTDRQRTITFDVQDDTAYADMHRAMSGDFYVVAFDSNHTMVDSFVKVFSEEFERRVRFVRTDSSSQRPWRIDAITIGNGGGGDKVRITNLSFYSGDATDALFSYDAADLSEYFIQRNDLPTFNPGDTLRIELTVDNDDPVFDLGDLDSGEKVFMHYGRRRGERARRGMNDAGVFGDAAADDNIFTRLCRAHNIRPEHQARVFNMHYVTIDNATLYISDGGYNTAIWSLPYKIVRP
ncbi:MAG TPA: hypothetical protein QGF17_07640 [Candidatus Marinimicrobia bacterium]|jgi:hypothetical protein|nr:hypothetical protein [Candidatus Neomarinimicrobiota bacterium]